MCLVRFIVERHRRFLAPNRRSGISQFDPYAFSALHLINHKCRCSLSFSMAAIVATLFTRKEYKPQSSLAFKSHESIFNYVCLPYLYDLITILWQLNLRQTWLGGPTRRTWNFRYHMELRCDTVRVRVGHVASKRSSKGR